MAYVLQKRWIKGRKQNKNKETEMTHHDSHLISSVISFIRRFSLFLSVCSLCFCWAGGKKNLRRIPMMPRATIKAPCFVCGLQQCSCTVGWWFHLQKVELQTTNTKFAPSPRMVNTSAEFLLNSDCFGCHKRSKYPRFLEAIMLNTEERYEDVCFSLSTYWKQMFALLSAAHINAVSVLKALSL